MTENEKDYVLGTHDEELQRLGLQHRVWRSRALDAWRRAGITAGSRVLDLGCGPGYAAIDLAEIVGPKGAVAAVDRSRRFIDALTRQSRARGLDWITTREADLDDGELPPGPFDAAWARWVFLFVRRPRALLANVATALRRGGTFVAHEYFDYSTWRYWPRVPEHEEFVRMLQETWLADGGEPNIGRDLAVWLPEEGFRVRERRTFLDVVPRSDFIWEWARAFIRTGAARLVELGRMTAAQAEELARAYAAREADPRALLVTPAVLEIVAEKE